MVIGKKHQQEGQEGHHHSDAEAHEGLTRGVKAGSLDHSQVITEAVVDLDHRTKSHVTYLHHCWDGQEGGQ